MVRYREVSKKELKEMNKPENFDPDEMVIIIPKWKVKEIESQGTTISEYLNKLNISCSKCRSMKIAKIGENKMKCGNCGNEYPIKEE